VSGVNVGDDVVVYEPVTAYGLESIAKAWE
jgi:hypothetical protein